MSIKGPSLIAVAIDDRFKSILSSSVTHILDCYLIGYGELFQPEISSFIDLIFWYFTHMQQVSTPGMKAFQLEFAGRMRRIFGCVIILLQWLYQRLLKNALLNNWRGSDVRSATTTSRL